MDIGLHVPYMCMHEYIFGQLIHVLCSYMYMYMYMYIVHTLRGTCKLKQNIFRLNIVHFFGIIQSEPE